MWKKETKEVKFANYIQQVKKENFKNKPDVGFIFRAINSRCMNKRPTDLYDMLTDIDSPNTAAIQQQLEKYEDIPEVAHLFIFDSWGLFQQNIRPRTATDTQGMQKSAKQFAKTSAVLAILVHLAKMLQGDKKYKNNPQELEKYFNTVKRLIEAKHLNFKDLYSMKTPDFLEALSLLQIWLKSDLLTKGLNAELDIERIKLVENIRNAELDIERFELRENIRQETYDALMWQCKFPMNDAYQWDEHEYALHQDVKGPPTDKIIKKIGDKLHDNSTALLSSINQSLFPRTELEKSRLTEALVNGYVAAIQEQKTRGVSKYVDLLVHLCTINHGIALTHELKDYTTIDNLKTLVAYREKYTEAQHRYLNFNISTAQVFKWIAPYYLMPFLAAAAGIVASLIIQKRDTIISEFDGGEIDFEYINLFIHSIQETLGSRIDIRNTYHFLLSLWTFVHFIIFTAHFTHFGHQLIGLEDAAWCKEFEANCEKIENIREKRMTRENIEHQNYMTQAAQESKERMDRPDIERVKASKLLSEAENRQKAREKAEKEEKEKEKRIFDARRKEEIEMEERRKEELKRMHQAKQEASSSSTRWKKKKEDPVPAPGPALDPREVERQEPAAVRQVAPAPQGKPITEPAVRLNPPQVVTFQYGDERRNVFISHVRAILDITQARLRQHNIQENPEELAALKYDVLQLCEHITAIRSKQGCYQKPFIDTLINENHIDLIYRIRNGLVHHDDALSHPEKNALYQAVINSLRIIGELHRPGTDIQPNTLCQQAQLRNREFPITFVFEPEVHNLFQRLIAHPQQMVVNAELIQTIQEKHTYLSHIAQRYLQASTPEETAFLSKALLMTIAELGEIYKEIYVNRQLQKEFNREIERLHPNETINHGLIEHFIHARRDIVHIKNVREGDVAVIISSQGSVLKQRAEMKMKVG